MTEPNAPTQAPPAPQAAAAPRQGGPCESCGAPLAADQRYCLNCGHRRGGPRVDYRHYMARAGGDAAPPDRPQANAAAAAPEEPEKRERDYAPLAAVGGIAVLGLMLLVGVLIGKGDSNTTAPAPQKVVLPALSGEPNTASPGSGENQAPAKRAKGGGGSSGTGAKKANGSLTSGANGGGTVEASTNELEDLEAESGDGYEEKSKKLPDKIATPGKPPPIDKTKPPGGGEGGAEVIK
jgi:hypothetical protein